MPAEAVRTFSVSISVSELNVPATSLVAAVTGAAEAQGGSDIEITISEDGTELVVSFALEASNDDEARDRGRQVLDAVKADEFCWQVGVKHPFTT